MTTLKPTDGELAILRVLWQHGPSTVREVHDIMSPGRSVVYTTTLKTLQVMTERGLTVREDHRGQHFYRARDAKEVTQRHLVLDLLDRAFGGSSTKLIVAALTGPRASAADLREISRLLSNTSTAHTKENDHE